MNITYNELYSMQISLVELINKNEFAISTNRKLKKIYKELSDEMKILEELKSDIIKKYAELDAHGEVRTTKSQDDDIPIFKSNDDKYLCDKNLEELGNTNTEVNIEKYKISETDFSHIKMSLATLMNLEPILIFNDDLEEN